MRNTLEDYEYNNAVNEVDKLLADIYCKQCTKNEVKNDLLHIPHPKKFVMVVLDAIGVNY